MKCWVLRTQDSVLRTKAANEGCPSRSAQKRMYQRVPLSVWLCYVPDAADDPTDACVIAGRVLSDVGWTIQAFRRP